MKYKNLFLVTFLFLNILISVSALDYINPSSDYEYNKLTTGEKILYSRIGNAILKSQPTLSLVYDSTETNLKVLNAYLDDHPGIFWADHTISLSVQKKRETTVGTEIQFEYTHTDNLEEEKQSISETCTLFHNNIKDMNDYRKLYTIYTFMCKYAKYNINYFDQSIYSVIHDGIGVCAGIARAFQYLTLREGIDCILCRGYTKEPDGTVSTIPHLWCMVKMNDCWYHIDPTSGLEGENGFVNYAFFMRSQSVIERTHVISPDQMIPEAYDDSLSLSHINNYYLSSYSLDKVSEIIKRNIKYDQTITIEFENKEILNQAVKDLFTDGKIFLALSLADLNFKQISYYAIEDIQILRITLL